MTNKHPILVGLMIIAILTLALVISTTGNVNAKNVDPTFLTYQNPDLHFKIQYPSNWTKENAYLPSHVIVRFFTGQGYSTVGFSIIVSYSRCEFYYC